jgi:hypothetical protein
MYVVERVRKLSQPNDLRYVETRSSAQQIVFSSV